MIIVPLFALAGHSDFLQRAWSCSEFILNHVCVSFNERCCLALTQTVSLLLGERTEKLSWLHSHNTLGCRKFHTWTVFFKKIFYNSCVSDRLSFRKGGKQLFVGWQRLFYLATIKHVAFYGKTQSCPKIKVAASTQFPQTVLVSLWQMLRPAVHKEWSPC